MMRTSQLNTTDEERRVAAAFLAGHQVANQNISDLSCCKPSLLLLDVALEVNKLLSTPNHAATEKLLVGACAARWANAPDEWRDVFKPLVNDFANIDAKATAFAIKNKKKIARLAEALERRGSMRAGEITRLLDAEQSDRSTAQTFAASRPARHRSPFKRNMKLRKKA
jgi:hypothetical protein